MLMIKLMLMVAFQTKVLLLLAMFVMKRELGFRVFVGKIGSDSVLCIELIVIKTGLSHAWERRFRTVFVEFDSLQLSRESPCGVLVSESPFTKLGQSLNVDGILCLDSASPSLRAELQADAPPQFSCFALWTSEAPKKEK